MSGFENYTEELLRLDREILHLAGFCGIDRLDPVALAQVAAAHPSGTPRDDAWENLRGLLVLRMRVETEMIELGLRVPPLGRVRQ